MRALRVILASFLLTGGVLLVQFAGARAAAATEPESFMSITLTSLSPALPTRHSTITVKGQVTNTSKGPLSNLQAIFWRSFDPIQGAEGMAQALASPANQPIGSRVSESNYQNIPSDADRTLEPGESTRFSLSLPIAKLTLPPGDGVFLVGVQVRGRIEPSGPDVTLGRSRVFLPVVETPPTTTLQLTSLVTLSSRPSLVSTGVLADDHLTTEITDGGRLRALLLAANQPDTSFAVDPELIEELETMKSGYRVLAPDGSMTAGRGQSAAADWLSAFGDLKDSRDGFQLLYGSPDVTALVHSGQAGLLAESETAAKAVSATAALPLLVVPANGVADSDTVDAVAALKPAAIVLSDVSTGSTAPLLAGPNGIPIVNVASTSVGGGPGPDPRETPVHVQQHTLAETWIEASTAPPGATLGEVRLITSAAEARGGGHDILPPWVKREPLTSLLHVAPVIWGQRYRYPASARAKELPPAQLGAIQRLRSSYATYADLLVKPGGDVQVAARAAVARSASMGWRGRLSAWRAFLTPQQADLDSTLRTKVTLIVTPRVVTSARRGLFPVTIRNSLPASPGDPQLHAIHVRLEFRSAYGQRLTVTSLDAPNILAGESFTGNAQVDAQSNGTVRVTAQLVTVSGKPVGLAVPIDVRATQAGTIGWFIAIGAGAVLLGTTTLRIRQVARERSATPPAGEPPPPAQTVPPANEPEHLDV